MYAIIETGGKQYRVEPEQVLEIEKLEAGVNDEVVFDRVLLINRDGKVRVGQPHVKGASVVGRLLAHGKGDKVDVFDYKCKNNVRRKIGHRQKTSLVMVEKIYSRARAKKEEDQDGA